MNEWMEKEDKKGKEEIESEKEAKERNGITKEK